MRLVIRLRSIVTILDTLTLEATFRPVLENSVSFESSKNSSGRRLVRFCEEIKQTVASLPALSTHKTTAGCSLFDLDR